MSTAESRKRFAVVTNLRDKTYKPRSSRSRWAIVSTFAAIAGFSARSSMSALVWSLGIAAVTMVYGFTEKPPSRGEICTKFVSSSASEVSAKQFVEKHTLNRYEGVNILVGDESGEWYYRSSTCSRATKLDPGVYVFSNTNLHNASWKCDRAKNKILKLLQDTKRNEEDFLITSLLNVLNDETPRPLNAKIPLPDSGYGDDLEQKLSSIRIPHANDYGTRSQYIAVQRSSGKVRVITRDFENNKWHYDDVIL